ncbi:RRM domain protein [Trachipleistophora hominis]|uniref:RRM domain protein n=1 Tax=Trachipleistophora hominis TaxID=72359 RepID=L7JZC7_TRAHO|nr:RRM domain protein [Trachipleistophora hominis]
MTELKKQLEFYFSNQNYHKDTYLRTTCEENDGIAIEKILKFKKLQPCNYSEEDVRKALAESKIVKINGDKLTKAEDKSYGEYVTRKHCDYTVVIEGLDKELSLEEIETELCKYFEPKLIRMMRNGKKKFLGVVKVELESVEEVERVVKLEIPVFGKKVVDGEEEQKGVVNGLQDDMRATKDTNEVAGDKEKDEEKKDDEGKNDEKRKKDEEDVNKMNGKNEMVQAEAGATKMKKEEKSVKKVKKNILKIYTEEDYRKIKGPKDNASEKRDEYLTKNKDKLYKFVSCKEWTIKDMKEIVKDVIFVDLEKKVLRFKEPPEQEKMKINDELEIMRMEQKECQEYAKGINFSDKKKRRKRSAR